MFSVEGLDEAQRAFERLSRTNFMRKPFKQYGHDVKSDVAPYPHERAGSDYRRTGNLGRGWYVVGQRNRVEVGNRVEYSGWVQDERKQAWYHTETGWKTVQESADHFIPDLEQKVIDAVYRELGL